MNMRRMKSEVLVSRLLSFSVVLAVGAVNVTALAEEPQYVFEHITVAPASGSEAIRSEMSIPLASQYLEDGAAAWNGQRRCVTCHTNGTYMVTRPSLSQTLGPPPDSTRSFFLSQLAELQKEDHDRLRQSIRPAQVIYIAAGLAEWDAHVLKSLSAETESALEIMFAIQEPNGTWGSLDCWPPFESDAYHEATVAAMAAATAPGWLQKIESSGNASLQAGVQRLKTYLMSTPPLHDYSRVLLLWANSRMGGLLTAEQKQQLLEIVLKHQRDDGGWSIRSFAAPEAWGGGNRARKLRTETDFETPASDGHMTGLALIVLRSSGIEASDARVQRGVAWLKSNQRESGRWWTRSLNTDGPHFITYSGTAYPLVALQMCDAMPDQQRR
jgi:squalene-hopene/tetraprenyl-beta-curcumene cyclase